MTNEFDDAEHAPMLGALDIVEAFTALRHELKLQVRAGRTLQQELTESLQRIEQGVTQAVSAAQTRSDTNGDAGRDGMADELRMLAEVVTELEESLQRAIAALAESPTSEPADDGHATALAQVERLMDSAPWIVRTFASDFLGRLRTACQQVSAVPAQPDRSQQNRLRGLELLLERVRRQMKQCGIERVDVLHQPFDATAMQAVDVVDDPQVHSGHVAHQLRPAYRRHGRIFRYAEVRVAR